MTAMRKNLTVDTGTTFTLSVRYLDSNKNPVNLTGYGATFGLYAVGKENQPATYTNTPGVTSDGWINVKVTDEETTLWNLGKSAYRLDLTDPSGDVFRLLFGALEVRSGVNV